jgi:SAM-dependent methyltransferase
MGKRVLDLGCGEGYGANAIAKVADFLVAADYSIHAVAHARRKYGNMNTAYVVCDAQNLPFRPASFGTILSFEVIEHIPDVRGYLDQMRHQCLEGGVAIISTPNRSMRLLPFQKPWNRFHLREYDHRSLARTLGKVFSNIDLYGVTAIPEIVQIEWQRVRQNPFVAYPKMIAQIVLPDPIYAGLRHVFGARVPGNEDGRPSKVGPYTTDDFAISADGLETCINLVAVLRC